MAEEEKIAELIANVDAEREEIGLINACKKYKIKPGKHVVFINAKRDRIKMFSPGGVLSYARLENGRVNLEALQSIPKAFDGDLSFAYDKALTKIIREKLHLEQ